MNCMLGVLIWRRRRPRPVVVDGQNIAKKIGVGRVVFDTGFGFRVQIDLVPHAFGEALNPKP